MYPLDEPIYTLPSEPITGDADEIGLLVLNSQATIGVEAIPTYGETAELLLYTPRK